MLEAADAWEPEKGSLFLIGDTGVGKTACLTRMLRRWLRRGQHGLFVPERDVCWVNSQDLENGFYPLLIQRSYTVPVLVLDDVINPRPIGPIVTDMLQTRIPRRELATIVGSMYTSQELAQALGLTEELSQFGTVVEDWSYRFDLEKMWAEASAAPPR